MSAYKHQDATYMWIKTCLATGFSKKGVQKSRRKANIMISKTKNQLDGACGMYGEERCIQSYGVQTWGKRPLEDLGIDGRMILK